MTDTTMISSVSLERLQELLQARGYRVTVSEQEGLRQLLSATQGIGFSVRPGNPGKDAGEFIDYTLSCALRIQGDLPDGLADSWNVTKRFARLSRQATFLVLEMDVVLAGGVSEDSLRASTELWDRLLQELILFLREYAGKAALPSSDATAAAENNPSSDDVLAVGDAVSATESSGE